MSIFDDLFQAKILLPTATQVIMTFEAGKPLSDSHQIVTKTIAGNEPVTVRANTLASKDHPNGDHIIQLLRLFFYCEEETAGIIFLNNKPADLRRVQLIKLNSNQQNRIFVIDRDVDTSKTGDHGIQFTISTDRFELRGLVTHAVRCTDVGNETPKHANRSGQRYFTVHSGFSQLTIVVTLTQKMTLNM